jgi:hypothetical protein
MDDPASKARRHCRQRASVFAVIGFVISAVCMTGLLPTRLVDVCAFAWPTGFLLLDSVGFEFFPFIISASLNALIWAGLGWLIGYGTSGKFWMENSHH